MRLATGSILHELEMKPENQIFFRQLTNDEAKIITTELLECLRVFDTICRENHLTYMILAGGLIGLIREGHLLPWDDDIDLVMPKDDYRKFQEVFKNSKYSDEYCFKYPEDNKVITMGAHFYNRNHSLTKLISENIGDSLIYESYAYLDILPLDCCDDNYILNKIKGHLVDFIQMGYISRRCFARYDPFLVYLSKQSFELRMNLLLRRIFALPFLLLPKKFIFSLLDLLLDNEINSHNMTISYGALRYFGETLPRDVFLPTKDMYFDEVTAMIPNDSHRYLRHRYGDYMKAPSKAERNTRMIRLRGDWEKYVDRELDER